MALTKETKIIKTIIVGDYKAVELAEDLIVKEDGVEISRTRHRRVLHPHMDITSESEETKTIANAAWTDEIKNNWETFRDKPVTDGYV